MWAGEGFRFVHCADLHLDSQFKGVAVSDPLWAEEMRESTFTALERIVDIAIENDAAAIVLAGDVFDHDDRSIRAQFRFRDAMARAGAAGVTCFLACGNHDPLEDWGEHIRLPENVHRFNAAGEAVPLVRDGKTLAMVSGISHPKRGVKDDLSSRLEPAPGHFNIAILHCNISGSEHDNYAPTTKENLQSLGFDYWALGHVHQRQVVSTAPYIVYPGNVQGRHVNERGAKGCYLVTVSNAEVASLDFVPVAPFEWRNVVVDITGHEDVADLADSVAMEGEGIVAEVSFVGRGPLHAILRDGEGAEDVAQRICAVNNARLARYHVHTRPLLDLEAMTQGHDLLGSVLRKADIMSDRDSVLANLLSNQGASRFKEWLESITDEEAARLIEDAKIMLADSILGDER